MHLQLFLYSPDMSVGSYKRVEPQQAEKVLLLEILDTSEHTEEVLEQETHDSQEHAEEELELEAHGTPEHAEKVLGLHEKTSEEAEEVLEPENNTPNHAEDVVGLVGDISEHADEVRELDDDTSEEVLLGLEDNASEKADTYSCSEKTMMPTNLVQMKRAPVECAASFCPFVLPC